MKIFSKFDLGNLELKNRIVMAPMTRSRATANKIPTDIMVEYYKQRADAGLIILVHKMKNDLPLNNPDFDTFYTPGEKGYTDYPFAGK